MRLNLKQITEWMQGQIIFSSEVTPKKHSSEELEKIYFDGIGTDTRKDLSGLLFFALRGDQFDAHLFVADAIKKGAKGVVIDQSLDKLNLTSESLVTLKNNLNKDFFIIHVKDTLSALQDLAHNYRKFMGTKIIGITGSNGKTTSKEFAAALLSQYFKVHYSKGSFNNHWGVPLSLLDIKTEHQVAVIEMGMNHHGEIKKLVEIAEPDIVVCTMVGFAHIEHFGTQDEIAKAKGEIYQFSNPNSIRIFNQDNIHTNKLRHLYQNSNSIIFSELDSSSDICLKVKEFHSDHLLVTGAIRGHSNEVKVPIFGEQNITNIMVAAALGLALGLNSQQIWTALPKLKTNWGRNQILQADNQAKIIFDGYNANPDSMKSLLENFKKINNQGKKVICLAEMLELGKESELFHFNLGKSAAEAGGKLVSFYGNHFESFQRGFVSVGTNAHLEVYSEFNEEWFKLFSKRIEPQDVICIKGSRGMKTERMVKILAQAFSSEKT